ncbi:MAG: maleylpyruvate isomerase N-terminal domain-containing protein [Actinomycetota bacterium]|nr:maleylpyruvate isomerase N-terminal domain-containing protein [Actinomycetota bacterium]
MTMPRPVEAAAFLEALDSTPPTTLSACVGWTAHEVTAHLTAGAAEVSRHLDPFLHGEAVPATRSFEEREAPYRAMDDGHLRQRLGTEEQKVRSLIDQVLASDPAAVIPWTGRQMPVAKFAPHMASEFAIHGWDLAGDSHDQLLAQPGLVAHAVGVLGPLLLRRGAAHDPDPGESFAVRLRSGGQPDVRISVEAGTYGISLEHDRDSAAEPWLECDPAARLLFVWGRCPDRRHGARSHMSPAVLTRLQTLLAGY